jgi:two-component system cell cycle response regulator DivK
MKKKVLLVEDNEDNRDLVSFIIKGTRLDVELLTAENGEEGLNLAFQHIPDLILMDMQMPVMDGWEAVPRLRSDPRTEAIPIVALTAQAKPEDKQRTKEIGCVEHLSKPMAPEELVSLVKRYLNV